MADIRETMGRRLPELTLFDSHERAKAACSLAYKRVLFTWRFWAGYVLVFIGAEIALSAALHQLFPHLADQWRVIIVGGVSGGGAVFLLNVLLRNDMRRQLRRQLINQCVPVCLKCGYDLRGQIEPRCPECGAACDPRLIRDRPHNRPPTI